MPRKTQSNASNPFVALEAELSSDEGADADDVDMDDISGKPGPSTQRVQNTTGSRNNRIDGVLARLEMEAIRREEVSGMRTGLISHQHDEEGRANDSGMSSSYQGGLTSEPHPVEPSDAYFWSFRKLMLGPEAVAQWTKHEISEGTWVIVSSGVLRGEVGLVVGLVDAIDLAENSESDLHQEDESFSGSRFRPFSTLKPFSQAKRLNSRKKWPKYLTRRSAFC
ncbi:hypothetical protein PQX77_012144 [Marasmius sp. AFHP31]|nr:hypothetical protein PQX77_012144 [Marasmius sp. AFHP31]